ncbi:MAG: hypothetical protein L0271_14635 [Gemmatimonadetes bacterium]|nr:hypothetical protein [Gemmatimonadota bacterium]
MIPDVITLIAIADPPLSERFTKAFVSSSLHAFRGHGGAMKPGRATILGSGP